MKKFILLVAGIILPLLGIAQTMPEHVSYEKGVYALKMSPNGTWYGSLAGNASLHNTATGEIYVYPDCLLGLGNAVTDTGIAVGDSGDGPAILYNGDIIVPEALQQFWFAQLNAITPDATRLVGIVNNTKRNGVSYVGFVADVNPDLSLSNVTMLPYPEKDLFGSAPQFVTAVWISDDGKTILGQVLDWRGYFGYPIVYKENTQGEWSYSLPSENLFNPTGIDIPVNPWLNEPNFPEPEDYMSGLMLQAYQMKYQQFIEGVIREQPIPEEYMTEEQFAAYEKAVNDYNDWYYSSEQRINDYIRIFDQVLSTSPTFSLNEMTLHPSGEYFMTSGGVVDDNGELVGAIYQFSDKEVMQVLKGPNGALYPSQILEDGTLIASLPMMEVPTSYIMLPGTTEFVSIPDYLEKDYPEISAWIKQNFPGGSGLVSMSHDKTVISGALIPGQLASYDENTDFYYSTYIINGLTAGVEQIASLPEDGVYKVFNLQGVKVLETKDISEVRNLAKGIYIVNGKKVAI